MSSRAVLGAELLNVFVLTVEHSSIAAAARALNLSPSLASRKIAQLERALGSRLFERTTRSIKLTEAGALALEWARGSIGSQAQLIDDLGSLQGRPSGEIRLVVSPHTAITFLPPLVARFRQSYPEITLSISTTDTLVNVVAEHYDVAIHSGRVPESSIVAQKIYPFRRVLCASPGYVRRAAPLATPEDLSRHACLVHTAIEPRTWAFQRGRQIVSQSIVPALQADSFPVLQAMALEGLGIIRMAQNLVSDDIAAGRLVAVLPEYQCVYPDGTLPGLWILYPDRKILKRTRLFVDFVVANLKKPAVRPAG